MHKWSTDLLLCGQELECSMYVANLFLLTGA